MERMYYAEYCRWGVNVSYESMGGKGNAFAFYAFDSKAKRDKWVNDNEMGECWNKVAATTRRIVEHCCGKDFAMIETRNKGVYICCNKKEENYVALELLEG